MSKTLASSPIFDPSLSNNVHSSPSPPPVRPISEQSLSTAPALCKKPPPTFKNYCLSSSAPAPSEALPNQSYAPLPLVLPDSIPVSDLLPTPPQPPSTSYDRINLLVAGELMHAPARASARQGYTAKQIAASQLPVLAGVFLTHVPMLMHVPIHTRRVVRDSLTDVTGGFSHVASVVDATHSLLKLCLFPNCALSVPAVVQNAANPSSPALTKLVTDLLRFFVDD